jgi:hypothetical protein
VGQPGAVGGEPNKTIKMGSESGSWAADVFVEGPAILFWRKRDYGTEETEEAFVVFKYMNYVG